MVPKDVQGIAYLTLLAEAQAKTPGLTPDQFKTQLRAQFKTRIDAALDAVAFWFASQAARATKKGA